MKQDVYRMPGEMLPGEFARSLLPALDFMIRMAEEKGQYVLSKALHEARTIADDLGMKSPTH